MQYCLCHDIYAQYFLNIPSPSIKKQSFYNIFLNMRSFRADHFSSLLVSNEKMAMGLVPYLAEIQANNIQCSFGVMQQLSRVLRQSSGPLCKINALVALLRCMETGTYPLLLFAEIYVIPALTKVIEFLLQNRDFQSIATYFEKKGLPPTTPYIQNMSYNFVALACKVFELGAIIKPFRVYQGQQYQQPSIYKRWHDKVVKEKMNISLNGNEIKNDVQKWRRLYSLSLIKWIDYADSIVYFFIEMLEVYFINDSWDKNQALLDILQYGQSIVTEETIARLIDIMAFHLNFDIRIKALKLFDRMILFGDVEALLVINFTENIETIIKTFWQVRGERSIEEGRHIYPEISGQQAKKLQFYQLFLISFQSWAVTFPNHQFLVLSSNNINDPSPIYRLYKLLREKKSTIFPSNPNLVKFETQARMAILQKTFRNRLILKQINNQSQISEVSIVLQHKLKDVQQYYQSHKEILVNLMNKKANPYEAMQKLAEFQLHFEQMVQSLSLQQEPGNALDKLIQNGLELTQIITLIHTPFLQLLHGQLTEKEFLDKIINLCVNYFSPREESQIIAFYSERVAHKKETLVEMLRLQRSDPLEKDLKYITNSIMVKQFRQKYKQKLQKLSSSKNSEQSELNLEIFTKTKFTRQSRQEMEQSFKFDKKDSQKQKPYSPTKVDLLQVKNNVMSSGGNSLKSSRQKKKLSLASKELQNRKIEHIQNENKMAQVNKKITKIDITSQTRTSRDQQSQKQQKVTERHVSFYQHSQYFSFIPSENYKFSYICRSLLIFKSPFLTIERIITKDQEYPQKVKIEFLLTSHRYLNDFEYFIQDQECIALEYPIKRLPVNLPIGSQFKIEIMGEMKKIPLRLPTIAMFLKRQIFFQYILPFTFNFFLEVNQSDADQQNRRLQLQAKYRCFTSNLKASNLLFPQQTLSNIIQYIPGIIRLIQFSKQKEKYVWLASYGKVAFLFAFQFNVINKSFLIRGYDANRNDDYNQSMLRYTVNLLAHLLGEREL